MKRILKSVWSETTGEIRLYIQINETTDDVSFEVQNDINKDLTEGFHFEKYSQALAKFKNIWDSKRMYI